MAAIFPIADPADDRIRAYRGIRERDLVGRQGLFVAEGKVVLAMLLASSSYKPDSLLIAEDRIESLSPLLDQVPSEVPIYSASQTVIDSIAGFPLHRGILAIGKRMATPDPENLLADLPERATVLLLSAIANHDNMGGIFRNAAAFGVDLVLLDSDCCDPLYRKAIRVSVGGVLLVPFTRLARGQDALVLLEKHGFASFALSPRGQVMLADLIPSPRVAVLLGAEGHGLSDSILARTTDVRIPMATDFDSLNVATASGIVLHHLVGTA